jgi:DNA-binding NtrC family response regulator
MVPKADVQLSPIRILVVEDDVLIRLLLSEELRDAGFQVVEAAQADDALCYLDAGGDADLVFSDIRMPGSLNGLELACLLRDRYPSLPIILTSGNEKPPRADEIGRFIPKPYDMVRAVSIVRETLGVRETMTRK